MATKLVVFRLPWAVDTEELRHHMSAFGPLDDCNVVKRYNGHACGYGFVTFSSAEDAKRALQFKHVLGNQKLAVEIARSQKEKRAPAKNATQIYVSRIPPSVSASMFRSYFEAFGDITDLYMPEVAVDSVIAPLRGAGSSRSYMDAAAAHGGNGSPPNLQACIW